MRFRSFSLECITVLAGAILAVAPCLTSSPRSMRQMHAVSSSDNVTGAVLYVERGCVHCHGPDGSGSGRGPDLSDVGRHRSKAQLERQIREGGKGMPRFGDTLQTDAIESLAEWLTTKRHPETRPRRSRSRPKSAEEY